MATSKVALVDLALIHESDVALRPVNRQSEDYLSLVESIKTMGILNPILVREVIDEKTKAKSYSLVDGLQRFTAAKDAGLKEIPAHIKSITDAQVLQAQIIGNVHRIEMKPAQYTKQIIRILALDSLMTITDLAKHLAKSTTWINKRLSLARLDPKIQDLVDNDKISLSNAYALATIPIEEQGNYVDRAMTEGSTEFMSAMNDRAKEIKDAKRTGKDAGPKKFAPVMFAQKFALIRDIYQTDNDDFASALVVAEKCKTPVDGVKAAIAWFLHMDKNNVKEQQAKDAARKAEQKAERDRRKKEREDRKSKEAVETQAEMSENAA